MNELPNWVPSQIDWNQPSVARIYDYALGGAHNFEADRQAQDAALEVFPYLNDAARANRAFLHRALQFCLDQGIRQFLDLGSGIPTVGNVHEVAQKVDPECRVVYVDHDPVAVTHACSMLTSNPRVTILGEDIRAPHNVLEHPDALRLIDFQQPVGLLMVGMLHYVNDAAAPQRLLREYQARMAPGSYLIASHLTSDLPEMRAAAPFFAESRNPMTLRSKAEIEVLLADFDLVDPGVVYTVEWRPDMRPGEHPERTACYAAVGHLR
ncbi:SAM-dependent methyltransferase [Saccharopolyspora mangrovi]|uniref:SAM-dependent methyltransferase n=1 Tax=Saccharopolyspora mangrovi TaxID=3082379 RepID=A0ABU6ABM8_9PSEU|nr:SAM-dependent methyltransferase [Saccharopolyspora sp. S2-29]MEB3368899.1 SAM-dependent methyltransferase [Saccharopolyspora sp. S2-29]